MKVISYIDKGNSFPIIVQNHEQKYFVKLRAGMSGKYSMINEWIGNKLASQLDINTQRPIWIDIDHSIELEGIYIEVQDLVAKSHGTNIGFNYLEMREEVSIEELNRLERRQLNEIYLFDLMMINLDRTPGNLNLLRVNQNLLSVDYESSMLLHELLENKNLLKDVKILQGLRNNPLYVDIEEKFIDDFLLKCETISIDDSMKEIPSHLISDEQRKIITARFEEKKNNKWFLKETMNELRHLVPETKEMLKKNRKRNQAEFLQKFKENLDGT